MTQHPEVIVLGSFLLYRIQDTWNKKNGKPRWTDRWRCAENHLELDKDRKGKWQVSGSPFSNVSVTTGKWSDTPTLAYTAHLERQMVFVEAQYNDQMSKLRFEVTKVLEKQVMDRCKT